MREYQIYIRITAKIAILNFSFRFRSLVGVKNVHITKVSFPKIFQVADTANRHTFFKNMT